MATCRAQRDHYERSAEGESDPNLRVLVDAHQNSPQWQHGGRYHQEAKYRIWTRVVRREARRRGLI